MITSPIGFGQDFFDRRRSVKSADRQVITAAEELLEPLARIRVMAQSLEDGLVEDYHGCYRAMRLEVEGLTVLVQQLADTTREFCKTLKI
jgi:hypothetical protein